MGTQWRAAVAVVMGLCAVLWGTLCECRDVSDEEELDFTTIDVAKLATHAYGTERPDGALHQPLQKRDASARTELILLENAYKDQTAYRFEDFFWTGSGDGLPDDDEHSRGSENSAATIYKTKTVVSTVFIESSHHSSYNETESTTKCSYNCGEPATPEGQISPSPTLGSSSPGNIPDGEEFFDADRHFWLLTVLRSDGKDPVIIDLKNSLARLYKTAFQRQQARHLGINGRSKRDANDKPVDVYIHKVNKSKLNGDNKIEVLYHVAVDGKPVSAVTAARDMTLVSDDEVRQELGYPFVIKAEPYLKPTEPQSLSKARNTWLFIGVSIIGFLIFLLVVAFLTLGLTKRKRIPTPINVGVDNRRQIFEREGVQENKGFSHDENSRRRQSSTYVNFKNENSTLTRSVIASSRPESSISSTSSSSRSLDISPLMGMKKKQRTPPKKPPRPRAAINKTAPINLRGMPPEVLDSDSSYSRKGSPDTALTENYDPGVISPKSYLSMPSVKAFPRGNMPEPLNKVLEPVSVLHLDMPEEDNGDYPYRESKRGIKTLVRHGSVGAVEDPGVIGPIVWNIHCQRLQHGVSVDEGIDDLKVSNNVSRMRKRFHDLLDDTFSLFGSRRDSPIDNNKPDQIAKPIPIEVKSHSAANNRSNEDLKAATPKPRPKTSDLRKVDQSPGSSGPKGAWSSKAPSPLVRPLSAGIINPHPRINVDHVLSEGKFKANDPAVPLIAAIKSEIERVSLPGSTTDLRD
ncbi:hypothetical protein NQ318_013578 [Aromia moschata]|uniref:Uncharacterized protein n=1 Tax=Aromia moschata TaxID=1265417 RepID=A0AAV8YGX8_9CUCU|nr:hypothetical protein NQ318_013578 [Aromia moschata]